MLRRLAAVAALSLAAAPPALAGAADGLWRTEANEDGAYLVVDIGPCSGDAALTCGVITSAHAADGTESTDYEHLGRQIIKDMAAETETTWDDGEIWAPDDDKSYSSSMALVDGGLKVEGCVLVFCRSQLWTRAE